jgi:hypothetical protein
MIQKIRESLLEMFSDIRFDESRHLYFINGDNYPSVSKKLELHYEKFNKEVLLPRCAAKEGISISELEEKWNQKRDIACDMGHDTHYFLETYRPGLEYLADIPQKKAGIKFFRDFIYTSKPRYFIITQELRMVQRIFRYCGTTDLLLWDSWEEKIVIADWKTNEDLFKTYGYLKPPFDYFESNPFNKYQLQFNYYQLCIEQGKYKVGDRWLIYLDNQENYTIHKVQDLTKQLREFLTNPNQFEKVPAGYGLVW